MIQRAAIFIGLFAVVLALSFLAGAQIRLDELGRTDWPSPAAARGDGVFVGDRAAGLCSVHADERTACSTNVHSIVSGEL